MSSDDENNEAHLNHDNHEKFECNLATSCKIYNQDHNTLLRDHPIFGVSSSVSATAHLIKELETEHRDLRGCSVEESYAYADTAAAGLVPVKNALTWQNRLDNFYNHKVSQLKQWISSASQFFTGVAPAKREIPPSLQKDESTTFTVLGIQWPLSEGKNTEIET